MKRLSLFIAALLAAIVSDAQITLTSASYPASVIGTDSLKVTTHGSAFPSLTPATNAMWDMSIVTDTTPVFFAYRVAASGFGFADSNTYSFAGYGYSGNILTNINSSGILQSGISIARTGYSITSLTGGISDSLIINQQTAIYSAMRNNISFPASIDSHWSSAYNFPVTFQLSAFTFTDAPGIIKSYVTEKDSVVGWGKMRVKDAAGSPSIYFDVLQVKTITLTSDSFFINGVLAPAGLLLPLGVSQGQTTKTYEQNYYREGEVTPLANVQFTDSTFTTPYKATTHAQRLSTNAVSNVVNGDEIKVYPNPAAGSILSVQVANAKGAASYVLSDISGRIMQSGALPLKNSIGQVSLAPYVTDGVYYLTLMVDGKAAPAIPVSIKK